MTFERGQLGGLAERVTGLQRSDVRLAAIEGFLANFFSSHATVGSSGREYIQQMTPRANMFLERSASFLLTPEVLDGLDGHRRHRDLETW